MRLTRRMRALHQDDGMAMGMVILLMVVAMFIVVAIAIATMSASSRARDAKDRALASAPTDIGIAAYQNALGSGQVGESTGYTWTTTAASNYVASHPGAQYYLNNNAAAPIPAAMRIVDTSYFAGTPPLTMREPMSSTTAPGTLPEYAYWQIYSLVPPRYGATQGGSAVVYFRGWVSNSAGVAQTRPVYIRVQFRGPAFSDFEELIDGKIAIGADSSINGRIHSNGFNSSLGNMMSSLPDQITLDPAATCGPSAQISTTRGSISAPLPATCPASKTSAATGALYNLQRVTDSVRRVRQTLCGGGTYSALTAYQHIRVACPTRAANDPSPYYVNLGATTACWGSSAGSCAFSRSTTHTRIANAATPAGTMGGTLLIFDRDVHVTGQLNGGRLTIVAAAPSGSGRYLGGDAPSIILDNGGGSGAETVGAVGVGAALGLVAEGDVIADEQRSCPLRLNAAIVAVSGLLSINKPWRDPFVTKGGTLCTATTATGIASPAAASLVLNGSITGHYAPGFYNGEDPANGAQPAGYDSRLVQYNAKLFDAPPPMFARIGNWQVERSDEANLSCFATGSIDLTIPGCG